MEDKNNRILTEAQKRFKSLLNYDYYTNDRVDEGFSFINDEEKVFGGPENDIILGGMYEADEEGGGTEDELADIDAEIDDMPADEEGGEEMPPEGREEAPADDAELDLSAIGDEEGGDMEGGEDEVELDVTELVQSSDEAKASADAANEKIEQLMGMVDQLESKLGAMNNISAKVGELEAELEKRVPTPEEKIEMRSLSSYPYNIKLSDYWEDKEDQYVDLDAGKKSKPDEQYTLTKDDIDSSYNEAEIRNSFEEEDIEDTLY